MDKFWRWVKNKAPDPDNPDAGENTERTLFLDGTIASESWFDDDVTPALFKDELNSGSGNITLWINSPGGDCFAAASIYNMLRDYKGKVTVKIDGLAASAASVIAMAGDVVEASPVSMIMIHNPATIASGDHNDMQKAIEMLDSVKDSIINAYAIKTGLSRNKLASLMENETWMDARMALNLHFVDSIIERDQLYGNQPEPAQKGQQAATEGGTGADPAKDERMPMLWSERLAEQAVTNKVVNHYRMKDKKPEEPTAPKGYKVDDCMARLDLIKKLM